MKKLFLTLGLAVAVLAGCDYFVDPGAYNDQVIDIQTRASSAYNDYSSFTESQSFNLTSESIAAMEEKHGTTLQSIKDIRKEMDPIENLRDDSSLKDAVIADIDSTVSLMENEEKELLELWKKMAESDGDYTQEDIDKESEIINAINAKNEEAYNLLDAAQQAFAAKYGYEIEPGTYQP